MLRRVLRMRGGALWGASVILTATATIAAAAGQIVAAALGAPGAGRFAAVDAVVRANPTFRMGGSSGANDEVTVQRSARLPSADVARIAEVPGVRSAVGDVAFPVTVAGAGGAPVAAVGGDPAHGHGWDSAALAPYRLVRGAPPSGRRGVVLDSGLAHAGRLHVGDRVRIATPAGAESFRLSGIARAPAAIRGSTSSVFFQSSRAQALSGLGAGVDAIAVWIERGPHAAAVRRAIAREVGRGAVVYDRRHAASADAGDPGAYERAQLPAGLASVVGLTLAIAVFVVAQTIAFAVRGRRREIALTRAVGATPGQVRRALLAGTALVGIGGGVAGCALATALLGVFVRALVSLDLAPHGFVVSPDPIPYGIAVGVGLVVALAATLVATRRTLRVSSGEALVQTALPDRRLGLARVVAGLVATGGGITGVILLAQKALSYASLNAFCFMIAVALLAPAVIGWPVALLGRPLARGGGAGFLASSGLAAGRFRVGAAASAVALVVALTGTQVISIATVQRAARRTTANRVHADRVLVDAGGAGLPVTVGRAAGRLPGAVATVMASTQVYLLDHGLTNEDDPWNAAALNPSPARGNLALGVTAGSLSAVRGHSIGVSRGLADAGHVGVGSRVHARLADGAPMMLRIVAVYRRAGGLGDVVMPAPLARAHATAAVDDAVFVTGGRSATVQRRLRAIVRSVPGAALLERREYLAQVRVAARRDANSAWVVDALMIFIAVLAAFNAGATAAAERRQELGLARLTGATGHQLARALACEALLTTAVGIAVGAAVVLASFAQSGHDPTAGPLALPPGRTALIAAGAGLLGILGQLAPAALARRPKPAQIAAATAG